MQAEKMCTLARVCADAGEVEAAIDLLYLSLKECPEANHPWLNEQDVQSVEVIF